MANRTALIFASDFGNRNLLCKKLVTGNSKMDKRIEKARGINKV